MLRRIKVIMMKEIIQVLREPKMRVLLVAPPLLQLIIFGYAVNLDVEDNSIGFMDQDRTRLSRALQAEFEGSRYFRIRYILEDEREVQEVLDRGQVPAVVRVLPGFARDLHRGRTAQVQVLLDGTDSNTTSILANYINSVIARFSLQWQQRKVSKSVSTPSVNLRSRIWFNPDLRSKDYFVPGVVVNIIALLTIMLTSMAIVREKEIGTMEQLMVSPIRPLELMLGKTLPFAAVGILEVVLVTGAALLVFGIPFKGSVVLLLFCSVLFLLTTLGAGLFISTLSGTQQQAMMGTFFFFLPTFMLSGFAFPIRNMPEVVQYLNYLNPVRYFLEICRGIFLKGTGVAVLWPQMTALLLLGTVMILFSALRFHKRLD